MYWKLRFQILKKRILDISEKEGFELDSGSAELIAILGDGSFRDAEGTLQKVLNFSKGKKIKREDVEKITGAPKTKLVNDFIGALASKNLEEGIKTVRRAASENLDMKLYAKLIIEKLRMALILKYAPKLADEMAEDLSEEDLKFLKALPSISLNSATLAVLLEAYQDINNAFVPELPLELALIKIIGQDEAKK